MGKQTKIVYTCDICGAEFDDELPTCEYCSKDYCKEHAGMLKSFVDLTHGETSVRILDITKPMCSECANDVEKWKQFIKKELSPPPPEFKVKA